MVLNVDLTLPIALAALGENHAYFAFSVHEREQPATHSAACIAHYGSAKSRIAELLNQRYAQCLCPPIDFHNWLYHRQEDEVAYFLNEAGSNVINHSTYKAPAHVHLWLGESGFIIGVEQKGKSFAVEELTKSLQQTERGDGSRFFKSCKSTIFFDNPKEAKVVYFHKHLLK